MRVTKKAFEQIKRFEGCRLEAYRDAVAIWTIGYGHTQGVKRGMVITQEEADRMFEEDIAKFESAIEAIPGCKELSPNRWDAIISLAYNIGIGNFKRSTLLKKLQSNPNNKTIFQEFLRWDKAKGQRLEGLRRRRKWEAMRWEGEV